MGHKPPIDALHGALCEYMAAQRAALLKQVDAIELFLGMERTADIRKEHKQKMINADYSTDFLQDG